MTQSAFENLSESCLDWIDSHTHLEHEYPFSIAEYLENSRKAGVKRWITIGTLPGKQDQLRITAESFPGVYFTVGIHPHEAQDYTSATEEELRKLYFHPKCVAVGEIGLDYYYQHSSRDDQLRSFKRQLELALEWNKPVVIHCRNSNDLKAPSAEEDLLVELRKYSPKASYEPGVIHCFTGTKRFAEECLRLGFNISFSGVITFKNAEAIREVVQLVPLDRILVETDSPFLAPVPFRGKPNQSAYMLETARQIAKVKGLSLSEISKATVTNTERCFKLATH